MGKFIAFRAAGQTRFTRAKTLGEDYSEQAIRERIRGGKGPVRAQKKARMQYIQGINLLIDIQAKIQAGKGGGYEQWAKIFNLKQAAKTLNYLTGHGITDYDALQERVKAVSGKFAAVSAKLRQYEGRMAEISGLETQIVNYSKTRSVYKEYKKSGWSTAFRARHEPEIITHEAAKKAFDALHADKLPKMAELKQEYAGLLDKKREQYKEYSRLKKEQRELQVVQRNVDRILDIPIPEKKREKGKDN